jgi:tetratricopeptide (TPR) repeat protein
MKAGCLIKNIPLFHNIRSMKLIILFLLTITGCKGAYSQVSDSIHYSYLIERGVEFYQRRELDSSLYFFEQAIKENPDAHVAYFRRSLVLEKLNDPEGSIRDLTTAIKLNPSPQYYNNRAMIRAISGKYDLAIEDYDQALELDSLYGMAWFNKAIAQHYAERRERACDCMRRARELNVYGAGEYLEEYCK